MDKFWKISGWGGQHDEAGATIITEDGFRVCQTLDVWEAGRILGSYYSDPLVWKLYREIPENIVKEHNENLQRETSN